MNEIDFTTAFRTLTGMTKPEEQPFPWQRDLYENWFSQGKFPDACTLPTGLGKTSVVAIWLIALANAPDRVPRRLVYIVNRRTVVDQTTTEAEKLRRNAAAAGVPTPAISTLRGQFADNREWSADPSKPAVVAGTVDMIGSRLLFCGYGCGFKSRPLHAGFLGQDVLLVHDEAHLEPAFQELIVAIRKEQKRCQEFGTFRVMEMTATSRGSGTMFLLSDKDRAEPEVRKRIEARKAVHLHENKDEKKLADEIGDLALKHKESGRAVLVFVRKVDDVDKVVKKLPRDSFEKLTGTLRGLERDALVKKPIFQRFLPASNRDEGVTPAGGAVYLVCTSAGEVGVNISADHQVCDLSTFDSMAQRFGRVNRFGDRGDTRIDIVYPKKFDDKDDYDSRLKKTLDLLRLSNGEGSPAVLSELHQKAMKEGAGAGPMSTDRTEALRDFILDTYAPQPKILPVSDILFDAWALTTVRDLPGRPPVAEYLHGVENQKLRETYVAWREEVDCFLGTDITEEQLGELLDEFPLRPHELLRDATWRVQNEFADLAKGRENTPVWVIDLDDTVRVQTLGQLVELDNKKEYVENLSRRTIILPPSIGGLTENGTLSGKEAHDPEREYDVAGRVRLTSGHPHLRFLVTSNEGVVTYKLLASVCDLPSDFSFQLNDKSERARLREVFPAPFPPMRVAYRLDLRDKDEEAHGNVEYLVLKPESHRKVSQHEAAWPVLDDHRKGVKDFAAAICSRLALAKEITRAVVLSAWWHDLGKGRQVWQRGAGNRSGLKPVSKTLHGRPPENLNHFRHELGSVIDVCGDPILAAEFGTQEEWARELTLHLIAAHHGRARPNFPGTEAHDPERPAVASASVASDSPARYARLQRRYGRWGLAYLESLIRAADALDSKRIEDTPIADEEPGEWPGIAAGFAWAARRATPEPTIRVAVDLTNPGQFFACCGLLELADRLWPGAAGWFSESGREFCIRTEDDHASVTRIIDKMSQVGLTGELTPNLQCERDALEAENRRLRKQKKSPDKATAARRKELGTLLRAGNIILGDPFNLRLDWWQEDSEDNPKTWAGTQQVIRIAQSALTDTVRAFKGDRPFDFKCVMRPVSEKTSELGPTTGKKRRKATPTKEDKVEPFYFDSRHGANALPLDIGFSPDKLGMESNAFPAVELLCLVGLQRCRPNPTRTPLVFEYFTWHTPLPVTVASPAVCGAFGQRLGYRFENAYRTDHRKHSGYLPATPLRR
jgi:CRISPR-associated endonuclease/helicase Cas3